MVGVVVGVVVVVVVCELVGVVVSDVVTLVVADVVADVVSVVESHRMYPSAHSCVPLRNGKHEPVSGSWHSPKVPVAQLVQYCATKSSLQRRNPSGHCRNVGFSKSVQIPIASFMHGPLEPN